MDNKRKLLYLGVNPTESSTSWETCFETLQKRGVKKAGLIVADGLKNLENTIHKYFPSTLFQKCIVHKKRNILNKIRPKDKAQIALDLNTIFNHNDYELTLEKAQKNAAIFIAKWGKMYKHIQSMLKEDTLEYYFSYLRCPYEVRKMVSSTNSIESLNRKIRAATRNKLSFEKESRLLDYIFVVIKNFEASNWMKYPVSSYGNWTAETH